MFSSAKLMAARESAGMSRSDLHRALVRVGVDRCRALVDRWESPGGSVPSANEAAALAAVLGIRLDELFDATAPVRS